MKNETTYKTRTSDRLSTTDVLEHSYVLTLDLDSNLREHGRLPVFRIDGLSLFLPDGSAPHYHYLKNDDWVLFIKGSLYLDISDTFDAEKNIRLFFDILCSKDLELAQRHIQGGYFNLYVLDRESGELHLINDQVGLSPQYYNSSSTHLRFSDNQFNLNQNENLSETALVEFLKFGYLPCSGSFYQAIQRAPAFSRGIVRQGTINWTSDSGSHQKMAAADKKELNFRWSSALARYFSRLPKQGIALGLSGGYDSRLLAAFAHDRAPQAIHFGHPSNPETQIAEQIAARLGLHMEIHSFPQDSVARYGPQIRSLQQLPTSLENAHVQHLAETVRLTQASYYLDGFLGGAILADAYFEKESRFAWQKVLSLVKPPSFSEFKHDPEKYSHWLYTHHKQALPDAELHGLMDSRIRSHIISGFQGLVTRHWDSFDDHYDLKEFYSLLTRGRLLIANGPGAVQTYAQPLLPFMDRDILTLSRNTPKSMRFGHAFYNELWKFIFPHMTGIRKAGTYGSPSDRYRMYRLKAFAFKLHKKLNQWLRINSKHREESYFSLEDYQGESSTRHLLTRILNYPTKHIPSHMHRFFQANIQQGKVKPTLLLRYMTLHLLLEDTHE